MPASSRHSATPHVFGLGSPHGDDQAGWLVVRQLLANGVRNATELRAPFELLDKLEICSHAIIVDACITDSTGSVGSVNHFLWPNLKLVATASRSTHGIDLRSVLGIAENIGRLPKTVEIFTVNIADPTINGGGTCVSISPAVLAGARLIADRLYASCWRDAPHQGGNAVC